MELSLELMFNKKTVQYDCLLVNSFKEYLDNKKEIFHKKDNLYDRKNLLNKKSYILILLHLLSLNKLLDRSHWGNTIFSNVGSKIAVSNNLEKVIDIFNTMNERIHDGTVNGHKLYSFISA